MNSSSIDNAKVLYVDDVKANLMLFEASFSSDFNVLLAESGNEALKILESEDIDVLVSDQNMPGMTGNELMEIVTEKYPNIMRFMITAYTDYDTVVDAINKGQLYAYFNKPYKLDDVKHAIQRAIEVRMLRINNEEMIQKLEQVNSALVGMDRTKTSFLSSVTNEIRTPINKIMTAVHMIKDKIDSGELSELLHMLDMSVRKLENFSEAAKQLGRLNNGNGGLVMDPVSLKELVEVSIIDNGASLQEAGIRVKFDSSSNGYSVQGEFELLLSCFSTLLEYISQHTNAGNELELQIEESSESLMIKIASPESNYSQKELEDIEALFINKDTSSERDFMLELFMANQIMLSHGGRVDFSYNSDKTSAISMIFEAK